MQNTKRQSEENKRQNNSWEESQKALREEKIKEQKRQDRANKVESFLIGVVVVIIFVAMFFLSQPTDF